MMGTDITRFLDNVSAISTLDHSLTWNSDVRAARADPETHAVAAERPWWDVALEIPGS
jgi:hypothetical protein